MAFIRRNEPAGSNSIIRKTLMEQHVKLALPQPIAYQQVALSQLSSRCHTYVMGFNA